MESTIHDDMKGWEQDIYDDDDESAVRYFIEGIHHNNQPERTTHSFTITTKDYHLKRQASNRGK